MVSLPRALARISTGGLLFLTTACGVTGPDGAVTLRFDFNLEPLWTADFTDIPTDRTTDVGFVAEKRPLPAPLDVSKRGFYHSGFNLSDDLFMYFRNEVGGLEPDRRYRASFRIVIASEAGAGCDIGASSIWVKVGASTDEPTRRVVDGDFRLSVDKGEQINDGVSALVVGDIRSSRPGCPFPGVYGTRTLTSGTRSLRLASSPSGTVWLFFGTESGWEVPHETYFLRLEVELVPI